MANISVRDGNGALVTMQTTDNGGVNIPAHQIRGEDGTTAVTVTVGNALKVDNSGVTQPVSGTVAATQSGTWNIATLTTLTSITNPVTVTGTITAVTSITNPVAVTQSGTWNIGTVTTVTTVAAVTAISNALPAGNNNIGDVDVASLPATPAGTNLIGKISASDETSTIYSGTTALTPKFKTIAASSSGDNTIVASPGAVKLRVLAAQMVANGTVNAKWQSGASGTDLTGLAYLVVNSGYVLPYNPVGWFETATSALLNLNLSAGTAVGGSITYVEVT